MNKSVYDAITAAITGLTLGSPHVGRTNFQRLTGYSPIPHRMNAHASFDTWLVWQKHVEDAKLPESLGQTFLDNLEDHTDETAYGLMNLRRGFGPPLSGKLDNPLSNGSRALLRSLVWAFLKPEDAGKYACFDCSIDHADEGVWLPTALAYAVASLPPVATPNMIWEAFSSVLPAESIMHRVGPHLLENQGHPEAAQIFSNQFSSRFPTLNRTDIVASTSFVLLGLLHSDMNAERAMLLTAGCGGQADLTTATSAAIATYFWGPPPTDYINALDESFIATHSLKNLTPPTSITEFATVIATISPEKTKTQPEHSSSVSIEESSINFLTEDPVGGQGVVNTNLASQANSEDSTSHPSPDREGNERGGESSEGTLQNNDPINARGGVDENTNADGETSDGSHREESELPVPENSGSLILTNHLATRKLTELKTLLTQAPNFTTLDIAGIQVTALYLDTPVGALPVKKLNLSIRNNSAELKNLKLALSAPADWQVASRVNDSAIPQNTETSFPAVVQPPKDPGQDNNLRLQLDNLNVLIPFAAAQRYWLLGPFANIEGTGFTKPHPPEKNNTLTQSMSQAFSGRSDLGIRWQEQFYSGTEFDIEPIFNQGPGATFLYAHVKWPAGSYRVNAAFAGGFKLWIDGVPIISYNDSTPKPANHPNFSAVFASPGESRILIKLIRGRDPVQPLSLTFFDESGRISLPSEFIKDE